MVIYEGLRRFVEKAIVKAKQERVAWFISSPKRYLKFASLLDHELLGMLDESKVRKPVDENSLSGSGFLYCSNGVSSEKEIPLAKLYQEAPWEGGWLIVNTDGTLAIHRPEGKIDEEVCIEL